MDFKQRVLEMTASEVVMTMVNGLRNHMDTFGEVNNGVCFGCAATNMVCHIENKVYVDENIEETRDRASFMNINRRFLDYFEQAIDFLRRGNLTEYNYYAGRIDMATITIDREIYQEWIETNSLPCLNTEDYQDHLHAYEAFAKHLALHEPIRLTKEDIAKIQRLLQEVLVPITELPSFVTNEYIVGRTLQIRDNVSCTTEFDDILFDVFKDRGLLMYYAGDIDKVCRKYIAYRDEEHALYKDFTQVHITDIRSLVKEGEGKGCEGLLFFDHDKTGMECLILKTYN